MLEVRTAEEAMLLHNGYEHPIHLLITDIVLPEWCETKLAEELHSNGLLSKSCSYRGISIRAMRAMPC